MRRTILWIFLALVLCTSGSSALAQTAQVSGQVTDPQKAAIANADVRIVDQATGVATRTKTNSAGYFVAPFLQPSRYKIFVQAQGFDTSVSNELILTVGQILSLNFQMRIGAMQQQVTVDIGSQSVNTTDGSVSTVVNQQFVANMPLNGRSFNDLISMTPGVVTQTSQIGSNGGVNYSGNFSVNGQRTESNYYMVDGLSANAGAGTGNGAPQASTGGNLAASTALGTTQSLLSVDSMQEFRVLGSSYSAEYGRTPGGQFSLLTRSGTSSTHGNVFDYLRNDVFDANDWFNDRYNVRKAALRQNDFGGTVGGRIPLRSSALGDTFYFFSYEGLRLTQPVPASATSVVPDLYMRQNAVAAIKPLLDAFPLPTNTPEDTDYGTPTAPNFATFLQSYSVPSSIDATSIRVDHSFGPFLSLFFRYSHSPSQSNARTLSLVTQTNTGIDTYTLGATSALAAHIANEFRVGYTSSSAQQNAYLDTFGGADPSGFADAFGLGTYPNSSVYLYISFLSGTATLYPHNTHSELTQWNIVDTVNFAFGKHLLKAGIDYRHLTAPLSPVSLQLQAVYTDPGSLLTNNGFFYASKSLPAVPVYQETAAFLQDEWRVRPSLSLSLGLRWEVNPAVGEANGNLPYALLGSLSDPSTLRFAPRGTPLFQTAWYNFAPRLGAAWIVQDAPGWSTVLRAGGGVFFDSANQIAASGFYSVGFIAFDSFSGSLPVIPAQLPPPPDANPPYSGEVVYDYPQHLQMPYSLQWNAALEQSLGKSQSLTLNYVASNGRRLLSFQQFSLGALNPSFGTVDYIPSGITSNYQSLQVKFQRTVSKGLQALASYTWAHSLDYGSSYAAIAQVRGNSDFDVRNSFNGGLSWEIPSPRASGILRELGKGWGTDWRGIARTGFPITIDGNALTDPTTGNQFYGGLNFVPGKSLYLYGSSYPGGRAINKAAFTPATGTTVGTVPRNLLRGFGEFQINAAIRREFPITNSVRLTFRGEAFNILNRPNFGYINPYYSEPTFGQVTEMLNASLASVSSAYQQGGARSMQFALKLSF